MVVIELLETIEVEKHAHQRRPVATGRLDLFQTARLEIASVVQASQGIGQTSLLQPLGHQRAVQAHGHQRTQPSQKIRAGADGETLRITAAALRGLQAIFRPGFNYAKAGVMLLDLQTKTADQQELDLGDDARETEVRNGRLMAALDALNDRYGKGTLKLGSALVEGRDAGQRSRWVMKQERRTPRYTTRVGELVVVRG